MIERKKFINQFTFRITVCVLFFFSIFDFAKMMSKCWVVKKNMFNEKCFCCKSFETFHTKWIPSHQIWKQAWDNEIRLISMMRLHLNSNLTNCRWQVHQELAKSKGCCFLLAFQINMEWIDGTKFKDLFCLLLIFDIWYLFLFLLILLILLIFRYFSIIQLSLCFLFSKKRLPRRWKS